MQEPSAATIKRPTGMRAFITIWSGQIISILGSAMTAFAVTIWVYQETEKATALALAGFFFVTPLLLLSPVAGALVDRYNRRLMMMISDLASGATTIVLLLLHVTGNLEVWQLFALNAVNGAFQAFQWPAFSAAISLMLPKEQYGRANGLMELAGSGSQVFAPVLAGALIGPLGLTGILLIDIFTFVFAVGTLLFVHIPQPETTPAGREGQGSLFTESVFGFRYILQRPSLLGLQLVFMVGNFFVGIAFTVYAAMILARTSNNEFIFGSVQSAAAIGGVAGGAAMAAWGGPKRRVNGVLGGWMLSGLFLAMAGVARSLPAWAIAGFLGSFLVPFINGSNQAIWQAKVAPDVQGRVFSIRRLIAWFVGPIAALIAGPLVDLLLEPAMAEGGGLAEMWGRLVGLGPGAGMALLFVGGGMLATLVGLVGYAVPAIRDAEDILPDHDSPEALVEREATALPEAPASTGWSLSRKIASLAAAGALALLIVGLGWLQVKVLTASAAEPEPQSVAKATLVPTAQPSPLPTLTSTRQSTPSPTIRPTQPPSPTPTTPTATPTAVPPTPVPIPAVAAGKLMTYTLTVFNGGPSRATNVVLSDTLPAGAVFNWALVSQGTGCALAAPDGEGALGHTLLCDLGTVDNGAGAVITIALTIDPLATGLISNSAEVMASESDPNPLDNIAQWENIAYAGVDLVLAAQVPETVIAGRTLTYTLVVTNLGPLDATDVIITNGLSADMTFVLATPSRGVGCVARQEALLFDDSITLLCDVGDLNSSESATVSVLAAVHSAAEGGITSLALVGANETDVAPSNNSSTTLTTIEVLADLAIAQVDPDSESALAGADLALGVGTSAPIIAGMPLTYTIAITNNGPYTATNVIVHDALPLGVLPGSVLVDPGLDCDARVGDVVSCFLGDLGTGNTRSVVITVLADASAQGMMVNLVTVVANEADPVSWNNTVTQELVIDAAADLQIYTDP